jgi:hypothetical protein
MIFNGHVAGTRPIDFVDLHDIEAAGGSGPEFHSIRAHKRIVLVPSGSEPRRPGLELDHQPSSRTTGL